jgi:hypothetical protein
MLKRLHPKNIQHKSKMSTTNPQWKPATAADALRILALMRDFYAEEDLVYDENRAHAALSELLMTPSYGQIFLLRDDSEWLGYFVATFGFSLEFGGRYVLLRAGACGTGTGTGHGHGAQAWRGQA